jgi:hypothetical protein
MSRAEDSTGLIQGLNLQKEVTSATYLMLATDHLYTIIFNNATGITVTVDNDLPDNFTCNFYNYGAGAITFSPGTAVLDSPDGLSLGSKKVSGMDKFLANNIYIIKGELL